MSEEKCKFYKKQFLSKYCELFKQPCYGKHCNFIKEFTRLNELEQELQTAKEENEKLKETACVEDCYFKTEKEAIAKVYIEAEQDIDQLTQQNKQMREALEKIVLDIVEFDEIPFDKPMAGEEIQTMDKHNLILKLVAIQELAQQALNPVNKKEKLAELTRLSQEYGLYDDVKGVE